MIDRKVCKQCNYYEEGYCSRCTTKEKPTPDQFDTKSMITVIVSGKGYLIQISDIIKCDYNV